MKKDIIKFIEKESLMDILYRICAREYVGKCHGKKMILVNTYIYCSDIKNHGFDKIVERGAYHPSIQYKFCSECGRVSMLTSWGYIKILNISNYTIDTKQEIRKAWLKLDEDIKRRLIGE